MSGEALNPKEDEISSSVFLPFSLFTHSLLAGDDLLLEDRDSHLLHINRLSAQCQETKTPVTVIFSVFLVLACFFS